ncbi:hypothetical protein PIB30_048723 [Stylosanthes scabra]|uniref:Uncharacterized protein n=1 Tax=Stylosanthes scabra TaxID=79078 RepID=A0ABU6WF68_9FABA|nr:hypothetical protein [Stylosanthes scabra]
MTQQQLEEAAAKAAAVMYRLDRISHVSHNVTVERAQATTDVFGSTDRAVIGDRRVTATGASEPAMVQVRRTVGERVCGALAS